MENKKSIITVTRSSNIKNLATRINIKIQNVLDNILSDLNEQYRNIYISPINHNDGDKEVYIECKVIGISLEFKEQFDIYYHLYKRNLKAFKERFEKRLGNESVVDFEVKSGLKNSENILTISSILNIDSLFQIDGNSTFLSFKEESIKKKSDELKYFISEKGVYNVGDKTLKFNLKELSILYKSSEGKDLLSKLLLQQNFEVEVINDFLTFLLTETYVTTFKTETLKKNPNDLVGKKIKSEYIPNISDQYEMIKSDFKYFCLERVQGQLYIFFSNDPKIFNNISQS